MNYKVPSDGCYTVSALCPNCSSVMTAQINAPDTSYVKYIENQNARYRKALEKYANPETHSMDENGETWYGDYFDYKTARDALEGKE